MRRSNQKQINKQTLSVRKDYNYVALGLLVKCCFIQILKPGPNEDESCWEFKLSLSFGLKLSATLVCSQSNLNRSAQFFLESRRRPTSFPGSLISPRSFGAVDESPWERGWSTTLVLVWPEVMIDDESWRKLSWEPTLSNLISSSFAPGFIVIERKTYSAV